MSRLEFLHPNGYAWINFQFLIIPKIQGSSDILPEFVIKLTDSHLTDRYPI